jgi:hypothetical protein
MNLEEFGPDAKDEMSPSEYIQYCMEQYREYTILAMDPTINSQATKLYLEKASDYYARAQEAMDEIEPDNTDHLSDEDKALPNVSLADQEAEMNESDNNTEVFINQHGEKMTMVYDPETGSIKIQHDDINGKFYPLMQFIEKFNLNNEEKKSILDFYKSKSNTNEMFTKQSRQYDQWADDNDKLKAKKAAELSDKDKAMIDKYEDEEKEQEDSEINKIDAKMYRESVDLNRWAKLAGINEDVEDTNWEGYIDSLIKDDKPKGFAEMHKIILAKYPNVGRNDYGMFVDYDENGSVKYADGNFADEGSGSIDFKFQFEDGKIVDYSFKNK